MQAKNYSLAPVFNAGTGAVTPVQSAQNRTSTILFIIAAAEIVVNPVKIF